MNISTWNKTREIGKFRYILIRWVLGWGSFTAALYFAIQQLGQPVEQWYIRLIAALVMFPLAGLVVGNLTWNAYEKKFHL